MPTPSLPLPQPLRGLEIPSFTHYSIVTRLPEIARRTLGENDFRPDTVARIQQLIDEIPAAPIRHLEMPSAPDTAEWISYTQAFNGLNWLEVPWFFAEEYFYQRILEATGYFEPGSGWQQDPFSYQKRRGLETTADEIHALCERLDGLLAASQPGAQHSQALGQLLLVDLWGNQNDLSLWPAADQPEANDGQPVALREAQEHILDNHLEEVLDHLARLDSGQSRVDMIVDNAGFELVCDLALADYLLSGWHAARVNLHIKLQPVFVSDALSKDIADTLAFLDRHSALAARSLAERLESHLASGRLVLRSDPFWTSPLAMWDASTSLITELAQAQLLICKGDANYRRLLGDRHWGMDLPFARVVDYLPVPVLALRTLKSEIAVGIEADRIPLNEPDWMSSGRWGLVQFSPGRQQA
jgi:uncharacterized protein with ATP-grasp and redox domains